MTRERGPPVTQPYFQPGNERSGQALAHRQVLRSRSARNPALTGVDRFDRKALPMIMVPTTAEFGSDLLLTANIKDEERRLKLLGGGPLSFPNAATLNAVTLEAARADFSVLSTC